MAQAFIWYKNKDSIFILSDQTSYMSRFKYDVNLYSFFLIGWF